MNFLIQIILMYLNSLVSKLRQRRDQIVTSLHSTLGEHVEFQIPQGGIHLWCQLKKEYNEAKLLEAAIKRGVIFVPGLTMGEKKGFVRFTFARENEKNIETGIKRFSEAFFFL